MGSLKSEKTICAVIGDPIGHSLSPLMHNAAFEAVGLAEKYSYIARRVGKDGLEADLEEMRISGYRGISCTIPHKTAIMSLIDRIDPLAKKIGAVNTLVNQEGSWIGYNTDIQGIVDPIEQVEGLKGKRVALLGAGGAARAAVFGCLSKGAEVCVFNRTVERAERLAEEAGCQYLGLEAFPQVRDYDIVINTTSVGMSPNCTETPIPRSCLRAGQIVFDIVYNPLETLLLREAKKVGCRVIYGLEMFVAQGAAQFKIYTGMDAPVLVMHDVVRAELQAE